MLVGIDGRAFGWSGIGRYIRHLVAALLRGYGGRHFVVYLPRAWHAEARKIWGAEVQLASVTPSYYSWREQCLLPWQLRRGRTPLMHFTHFNAPLLYRSPLVVTIHDLTRFSFPPQRVRSRWQEWAHAAVWYSVVRRAVRIICVSETTRQELLDRYPPAERKSVVIREGVSEIFQAQPQKDDQEILRRLGISLPYLLNVGVWMRHKNHARLLAAFARVKARGWRGKLVITGQGRAHDVDVPRLARKWGVEREVIFPGSVSDSELAALYRHAEVFLFPSLAEGFGLPPLEAMASGVPVVAAQAGSLPEVLGGAAVWVDPRREQSIAEGVWSLLRSPARRSRYAARGLRWARRYRWEDAACATWSVYCEAWEAACGREKMRVH